MKAKQITLNRFFLLALATFLLPGCDRADLTNGSNPGEVEVIDNAKIFHLTDGIFIEEKRGGSKNYYLIESGIADYELTEAGLEIQLKGEKAGTYSTAPGPQGYVVAWMTFFPGEGPEVTKFQIEDETLTKLFSELTAASTVRDIYNLKQ